MTVTAATRLIRCHPDKSVVDVLCFKWAELQAEPRFCVADSLCTIQLKYLYS